MAVKAAVPENTVGDVKNEAELCYSHISTLLKSLLNLTSLLKLFLWVAEKPDLEEQHHHWSCSAIRKSRCKKKLQMFSLVEQPTVCK